MAVFVWRRYQIDLHWGMLLVTSAGVILTLALGHWQIGRAQYKDRMQQQYDRLGAQPPVQIGATVVERADVLMRRVEVRGEFAPQFTVYIDNRMHAHSPGYHVVTPMRLSGSERYVMVNRGWIASPQDRTVPSVATPEGEQTVIGTAVDYSLNYVELSPQVTQGQVWQNLVLARYQQFSGLDLQPVVIQQDDSVADGLVRQWSRPDLGRNTHLAYAFQWYALSLAIFIYYVVTHVQRRPHVSP
jgi:surfeit locus 1 family protein